MTGGVTAVDTAGSRIKITWRSPAAAPGNGVLYEVDPATGAIRQQLSIAGHLPDFASPSLSGGLVLVGTDTGVVAVSGAWPARAARPESHRNLPRSCGNGYCYRG